MNRTALLVIDPQNDYLAEGQYPLWNIDSTLTNIHLLMDWAQMKTIPIILVQHVSESREAPFFRENTWGVNLCQNILSSQQYTDIVIKHHADSFDQTDLESVLKHHSIHHLLVSGMMTQNCITHTSLSNYAENYSINVIADCCTTVDEMVHKIALNALSRRCDVLSLQELKQVEYLS